MSKHSKTRINLEYLAARVILGTLGHLPLPASMALGRAIGRLTYIFAPDLRRTGKRNLLLAFPEKSEEERKQLLLGCFRNLGRTLAFFSQFLTRSPETLKKGFDVTGIEHIVAAKALGKGLIVYTGHLGMWELTSQGVCLVGHPFSFLVRRIDNPKVEELVDRARVRFGNQTMDKLAAARSMVKLLRERDTLGLLVDLNTLGAEGIFVDFFGVPASTTFMVAKLALRTETPIIPIFAPWNEQTKKFDVQVGSVVTIPISGDEDTDVHTLTSRLTKIVEERIRQYPDQWLWIHKRWKTRPPGEPDIY
jgi:Kdo2-lipid IVA lauroyltransferase/acyltransferase